VCRNSLKVDDGQLVFSKCFGPSENRQTVLDDGYAMMIFYDVSVARSLPSFELYMSKDKKIVKTSTLAEFKKKLSLIPASAKLHYYNTCAGGTHHGLNPSVLENIKAFCKDKGIVFQSGGDNLFSICTCL